MTGFQEKLYYKMADDPAFCEMVAAGRVNNDLAADEIARIAAWNNISLSVVKALSDFEYDVIVTVISSDDNKTSKNVVVQDVLDAKTTVPCFTITKLLDRLDSALMGEVYPIKGMVDAVVAFVNELGGLAEQFEGKGGGAAADFDKITMPNDANARQMREMARLLAAVADGRIDSVHNFSYKDLALSYGGGRALLSNDSYVYELSGNVAKVVCVKRNWGQPVSPKGRSLAMAALKQAENGERVAVVCPICKCCPKVTIAPKGERATVSCVCGEVRTAEIYF